MHFQTDWPEALVIYMQGLPTPGLLGDIEGKHPGWQQTPGQLEDRDLKFFDTVLAAMKEKYPVDDRRIYATGFSNGGFFTFLLWARVPKFLPLSRLAPALFCRRSILPNRVLHFIRVAKVTCWRCSPIRKSPSRSCANSTAVPKKANRVETHARFIHRRREHR